MYLIFTFLMFTIVAIFIHISITILHYLALLCKTNGCSHVNPTLLSIYSLGGSQAVLDYFPCSYHRHNILGGICVEIELQLDTTEGYFYLKMGTTVLNHFISQTLSLFQLVSYVYGLSFCCINNIFLLKKLL